MATCVVPDKTDTFYKAKLVYHPLYSSSKPVCVVQNGNLLNSFLPYPKGVSTRSPSNSTIEATETFSYTGGLVYDPFQEIRV